jgi:hypothetical protein
MHVLLTHLPSNVFETEGTPLRLPGREPRCCAHRPELVLTRLQLTELLLEHYPDERSEALAHLDFAIGDFRDMKMQPSLERALTHREILRA